MSNIQLITNLRWWHAFSDPRSWLPPLFQWSALKKKSVFIIIISYSHSFNRSCHGVWIFDCCFSSAWHVLYCPPHSQFTVACRVNGPDTKRKRKDIRNQNEIHLTYVANERFSPSATCFVCIFYWCWMWHRELLIVSTHTDGVISILPHDITFRLPTSIPVSIICIFSIVVRVDKRYVLIYYRANHTEKYHDLAQLWLVNISIIMSLI